MIGEHLGVVNQKRYPKATKTWAIDLEYTMLEAI
jgi:hypothetical protein